MGNEREGRMMVYSKEGYRPSRIPVYGYSTNHHVPVQAPLYHAHRLSLKFKQTTRITLSRMRSSEGSAPSSRVSQQTFMLFQATRHEGLPGFHEIFVADHFADRPSSSSRQGIVLSFFCEDGPSHNAYGTDRPTTTVFHFETATSRFSRVSSFE